MQDIIRAAIAHYDAGQLKEAVDLLLPLMETAKARSARAYYGTGAVAPDRLVPYQWIELAIDRLLKERGAHIVAVVPVKMALNTALQYCED